MKSEFVSSVSHELRTPLTTIKTLSRLMLRDELFVCRPVRRFLQQIVRTTEVLCVEIAIIPRNDVDGPDLDWMDGQVAPTFIYRMTLTF